MSAISVPAHFDGEHILLDAPVELEPHTRLLVTILPDDSDEREDWLRLSRQRLDQAYGIDEPEYGPESIKKWNSDKTSS